jgi:hypothetical protein
MAKHHYVYHSYEEWGREYIGIRSCDCLPEEDIKYFGSFKDKTFNPTEKTILFVRETREEVAEIEIILHDFFDVAINPQFANRAKAKSTKFDTAGVIFGPLTEETKKKISVAKSGIPNTEKHKKKISEANSGEKSWNYGKTGALSHNSKAIIAIKPDGTELHFGSIREAARELGTHPSPLCSGYLKTGNVVKQGRFKGWQFVFENR